MLIRAHSLRDTIDEFTSQYTSAQHFQLSNFEWKQVEYLIDIVKPFNFFTTNIGQTRTPTVGHVFNVYDQLFDHLQSIQNRLQQKQHSWVKPIICAVEAAQEKLDKYYRKIYSNLGSLYGIATLLTPEHKSTPFSSTECWLSPDRDWSVEFEQQLKKAYNDHYLDSDRQVTSKPYSSRVSDSLSLLLQSRKRKRQSERAQVPSQPNEEIDAYLMQGML
jgi:hypothetical protein